MKTIVSFLLGLSTLILVTSATSSNEKPLNLKPVNNKSIRMEPFSSSINPYNPFDPLNARVKKIKRGKLAKLNITDTYVWYVGYNLTADSDPGYYDVFGGVELYDSTTNTWYPDSGVPSALTVNITSGSYSGYQFTVPEGDVYVEIASNQYFGTLPAHMPDYTANTSPMTFGSETIFQIFDYAGNF